MVSKGGDHNFRSLKTQIDLFARFVNQNQFFRQIRNFVFDLTAMPLKTDDHSLPSGPSNKLAKS
jgi:hypothetical protein